MLDDNTFDRVVNIIRTYGDGHTEKTHGDCCIHEQYQIVTKEMAMDAGDPNLEGQLI